MQSTLLDVLACRKTSGQIEGDLLFNGRPFRREMKRWFGYVAFTHALTHALRFCWEFASM
jgi:hypothetical protein